MQGPQTKPANNFALSDADENTLKSLKISGISDLLLLRALLAIRQWL